MEHLIIIGAAAAGTKAAAKARRENSNLKITLFTEDEYISYSACGIPFYIGGEFDDYKQLIEYTPAEFGKEINANIFTFHKVTEIIPEKNTILIKNLNTGKIFEENYTKLLITTGATPVKPPIEGLEIKNVFTIRTINDALAIKEAIKKAKKAVVLGGGYIGIEMLEAFFKDGLKTKLIEKQNQIMPLLDIEMANSLKEMIQNEHPNSIITSESVKKFIPNKKGELEKIELESGAFIEADLALIALGVKPNSELAKKAGIEIGETGAIKANKFLQTNIPNIYAAGDCCEKLNMITQKPVWVPLGSTANKEGRVAGINLAGKQAEFEGVLGSAVTKFFDIKISLTGLSEKAAKQQGYDVVAVTINSKDKAGYMKDSYPISIKMIADKKTKKLLGAQGIGYGDTDKRINIIASALSAQMTVKEYINIDISYAPPFSRAIDITTTAAYKLDKLLEADTKYDF